METLRKVDRLSYRVIGAIYRVHGTLGPGFLENIYRRALMIELRKLGIKAETEKEVVVRYEDEEVGIHRLDIVVKDTLILELKTVENLSKAHYCQLRSYLKATGQKVGLLVNFAGSSADIRRVDLTLPKRVENPPDSGKFP